MNRLIELLLLLCCWSDIWFPIQIPDIISGTESNEDQNWFFLGKKSLNQRQQIKTVSGYQREGGRGFWIYPIVTNIIDFRVDCFLCLWQYSKAEKRKCLAEKIPLKLKLIYYAVSKIEGFKGDLRTFRGRVISCKLTKTTIFCRNSMETFRTYVYIHEAISR